jgi:alanine racemase
MTLNNNQRPTASYIDLDALAFNFHSSREFIGPDIKCLAVVKADAYGHGAIECSRRLVAEGVDWLGVALPEEGVELRRAGIKAPILCLGSFWPGQEELLLENELTPVVVDLAAAESLSKFGGERGQIVDVHVKIDTGMRRLGVNWRHAANFAQPFKSLPNLRLTGLMTHFASAENPAETEFTALQITRFDEVCDIFRDAGFEPEWIDLANSPAAFAHPASRGNLVRLGGGLYGLLDDILPPETKRPELKPVLSLRSQIAHLRRVPAGETLGYGRTFTTKRESLIALVPIGYADGYPRGLSNKTSGSVDGKLVPVVGRISMDWTLLDVTDVPNAAQHDDVFLIGGDAPNAVKAVDLAKHLGTISYEITCGISRRVPRVYTGSNKK